MRMRILGKAAPQGNIANIGFNFGGGEMDFHPLNLFKDR